MRAMLRSPSVAAAGDHQRLVALDRAPSRRAAPAQLQRRQRLHQAEAGREVVGDDARRHARGRRRATQLDAGRPRGSGSRSSAPGRRRRSRRRSPGARGRASRSSARPRRRVASHADDGGVGALRARALCASSRACAALAAARGAGAPVPGAADRGSQQRAERRAPGTTPQRGHAALAGRRLVMAACSVLDRVASMIRAPQAACRAGAFCSDGVSAAERRLAAPVADHQAAAEHAAEVGEVGDARIASRRRPSSSSSAPYSATSVLAPSSGSAENSSMIMRFGNIIANASSRPNRPPDAPTVGYGEPISGVTTSCASAAASARSPRRTAGSASGPRAARARSRTSTGRAC